MAMLPQRLVQWIETVLNIYNIESPELESGNSLVEEFRNYQVPAQAETHLPRSTSSHALDVVTRKMVNFQERLEKLENDKLVDMAFSILDARVKKLEELGKDTCSAKWATQQVQDLSARGTLLEKDLRGAHQTHVGVVSIELQNFNKRLNEIEVAWTSNIDALRSEQSTFLTRLSADIKEQRIPYNYPRKVTEQVEKERWDAQFEDGVRHQSLVEELEKRFVTQRLLEEHAEVVGERHRDLVKRVDEVEGTLKCVKSNFEQTTRIAEQRNASHSVEDYEVWLDCISDSYLQREIEILNDETRAIVDGIHYDHMRQDRLKLAVKEMMGRLARK
jgi:hypothetical protein